MAVIRYTDDAGERWLPYASEEDALAQARHDVSRGMSEFEGVYDDDRETRTHGIKDVKALLREEDDK